MTTLILLFGVIIFLSIYFILSHLTDSYRLNRTYEIQLHLLYNNQVKIDFISKAKGGSFSMVLNSAKRVSEDRYGELRVQPYFGDRVYTMTCYTDAGSRFNVEEIASAIVTKMCLLQDFEHPRIKQDLIILHNFFYGIDYDDLSTIKEWYEADTYREIEMNRKLFNHLNWTPIKETF